MKGPVVAYVLVISAMVTLAFGTHGDIPAWLIPTAAVAFMASDVSVARERFIGASLAWRAWGLPLYYAAQLTFALTCALA